MSDNKRRIFPRLNRGKLRKLKKALLNPGQVISLIPKHFGGAIPDKEFLELMFRLKMGRKLHLDDPKTFNEKIQWMKLYNRRPEYTIMVDKVEAKKYVAERIGEEYIIPTLGVWKDPDEIDFDSLPDQFVLKCNHNSGSLVICKDKSKLDIKKAKKILRNGLKQDYYKTFREWAYKDVPRRILAEKYMVDESGTELKDYKVFCFNGEPNIIEVDYGRFSDHMRSLYSKDWERIKMEINYPSDMSHKIERPESLNEMLDLARKLSKGIPQVRADFYNIEGKLYFGELTLYHGGGFEQFKPEEWDERLGKLIVLPPHVKEC